jgi:hypothetical protein
VEKKIEIGMMSEMMGLAWTWFNATIMCRKIACNMRGCNFSVKMPCHSKKYKKYVKSAALARAGHHYVQQGPTELMPGSLEPILTLLATGPIILNWDSEPESDEEVCSWTGGVNNHLEDNPEDWIDLSGMDSEPDDELEELEGDELRGSLETKMS